MTTFDTLEIAPRRLANLSRIVAVSIAAVALIALSFVLGRATMDHSSRTTISPAAVQPASQLLDPTVTGARGCSGVKHPC